MRVSQIALGRFHHFHLARQLEKRGWLEAIHTGYPRFKLRDETGIPPEKIRSFPWLHTPFMARSRFGLTNPRLGREWAWQANETLDRHAARYLGRTDVLIALSGMGLHAGRRIQRSGGSYVCDRGSSHIVFQAEILREEYRRWGRKFEGVHPRLVEKEQHEYATADRVTVPSEFVRRSFLEKGIPSEKIVKIPYGARLERFAPVAEPEPDRFTILFVGQVSLRKGFLDLVAAFESFRHPAKELVVIGAMSAEVREKLAGRSLDAIRFLGPVSNEELAGHYSRAHVFVLPSIEEGLSMVMGEALACGCPVIATPNTGAEDLFENEAEGLIVPIRDPERLRLALERLAQDSSFRHSLGEAALRRVKSLGGWDRYGDQVETLLRELGAKATNA